MAEGTGGILAGESPLGSEIALFLMQIILIMTLCQVLGMLLVKVNQPRVIAEVIGGILLGPTFLGRIPGFTETLFPTESLISLQNTATLGLVFFLFIVGMELDPALLKLNARRSLGISAGGQSFTWVIAVLLSQLLYHNIEGLDSSYAEFLLFMGVAMSLTAFPVLSRILTEGRLLALPIGITTIGSAAFDDLMAWSMLALVISLVKAGAPQTAAYIFLTMVAFVTFMLVFVRRVAARLARRYGAHDNVTLTVVFVCFATVLICAWFTAIIGVDAIFGAFVAGLTMPREGKLAMVLTEKIEDMVTVLLLPIFFALSGLKTDFGALDSAKAWGFAALVIIGACTGKIVGCGVAAKCSGLTRRDALCVGVLMNTRGLVELIILNAGLDAGVINQEVFAIMVLMAVVTTCMTAPLAILIFPMKARLEQRDRLEKEMTKKIEGEEGECQPLTELVARVPLQCRTMDDFTNNIFRELRLLVVLPGRDVRALASAMTAVHLLGRSGGHFSAARVSELKETFSADMAAANTQRMLERDTLMAALVSYCGGADGGRVSPYMVLAPFEELAGDTLALAGRLCVNTLCVGYDVAAAAVPHPDDPVPPAQLYMEKLLEKAPAAGISTAVVVDRGALAQSSPKILVPMGSFSACEGEALLLALAMAANTKAEVVVMLLGLRMDTVDTGDSAITQEKSQHYMAAPHSSIPNADSEAKEEPLDADVVVGAPPAPLSRAKSTRRASMPANGEQTSTAQTNYQGSNMRSLPFRGGAARGGGDGGGATGVLASLGQATWHGGWHLGSKRAETQRNSSSVRVVDAVRAALHEAEQREREQAGRELLQQAQRLGVQTIHVAADSSKPAEQLEALLEEMRPPRRTPTRTGAAATATAAAAVRYPLVVCGRRASSGPGSAPDSVLGRFGGGIAQAFSSASVVVVQSAAANGSAMANAKRNSLQSTVARAASAPAAPNGAAAAATTNDEDAAGGVPRVGYMDVRQVLAGVTASPLPQSPAERV